MFLVPCWNNRSNYFSWTFPSLVPSGTALQVLGKTCDASGHSDATAVLMACCLGDQSATYLSPACQYNGFAVTVLPQQVLLVVSHVPESSVSFQATPVYCTNKSLDFVTMRGYVHLVTPYVYHMWYTDVLMSDLINQLR